MSDSRTEKVMDAATALASLVSTTPAGAGSCTNSSSTSPKNNDNDSADKTDHNTTKDDKKPAPGRMNQHIPSINSMQGFSASSDQSFASSSLGGSSSATNRSKSTKFPMKLMNLLATPEYEHVIGWSECGTMFTIHNPKTFVSDVLPQYFKQAKFTSFLRKLYRWGFAKRTDMEKHPDKESASYFHPKFQKGRIDLCRAMSCSTRGGVIQDSAAETMGAAGRHQYFAQHGRPMMPDYNMNMGHFPGMMYGGGPQHPNYNYHGQPMSPPGSAPGNMLPPPPMNGPGPGPPGMMLMNNQAMNNGMMMENGMYKQDYPSMRQGHGNGMANAPQLQNGSNHGSMGMVNQNDAGASDGRKNAMMMGQGMQKHEVPMQQNNGNSMPMMNRNDNVMMDINDPSRKDAMMMENGVHKDDQRSSQQHPMQQGNSGGNMPMMNQNDNGMMRHNAMMMGHQGNRHGNSMAMINQNPGMQKHEHGPAQHPQMQQGNNYRGNMPMMGHYDQNGYYGQQQQGHYPTPYPPAGPSYPPMNGQHNGMMMPGQGQGNRGLMPNMYPPGPPPGRQQPQNLPAGPGTTIKSEDHGDPMNGDTGRN